MWKRVLDTVILLLFLSWAIPCQAQEVIKLHASVVAKTFGFGPVWVAAKQGFFNQQKLDVEVLLIRGSDVSTQALASGSLQVSGASADAPIAAFDRGLDMVIIGGIINGLSQSLMGGKNYKTYEDLRGATLGANSLTAGTAFALPARAQSQRLGIPARLQADQRRWHAAGAGSIGFRADRPAPLSLPVNFVAEEQGFNTIGRFIDVIPHYQLSVYSVLRPWAEKNRGVVVRFMKSIASAARWIFANKDAAVDLLAKEMGLKREYAAKAGT